MKIIIRPLLSILSIPLLSRMYGWLTRRENPRFLIKKIISFFAKNYNIDMNEYVGNVSDYSSLSNFFIRQIDSAKRLFPENEDCLISPADGFLTSINTIYEDSNTQAKGRYYKISEFIQDKINCSEGWHVATIYLSPHNYHRFHHTVSADIESYFHKKGSLFPVNSFGTDLVKGLFNRNERIITKYDLKGQKFYVVAVGATFVGSIKMEFINKIIRDNKWKPVGIRIDQLDEMGRFEMGSTIIMVVPRNLATPIENITEKKIRVGEPVFKLILN